MRVLKNKKLVYLDNATTSNPKPDAMPRAISNYLKNIGASPGRSSHQLAKMADSMVNETRELLAGFFGIDYPERISFTYNATYALNTLIKGTLKKGDHVIITNFEHNSVLRPIAKLAREKLIEYTVVNSDVDGNFNLDHFKKAIRNNTKLIICNHASNVIGVILPINDICKLAHDNNISVLLDASQTAGFLDIDLHKTPVDMLVFTGHKSLLGPSGIGGFYTKRYLDIDTLIEGGSGGNSETLFQPENMPDKFEAGTLNYLGIAGLRASLKFIIQRMDRFRINERKLTQYLLDNLEFIPGIMVYGTKDIERKVPIVAFNIDFFDSNELGKILNDRGILVRTGLHCAPLIHKTLGTTKNGTVRVSLGWKTTQQDVDKLLYVLHRIISDQKSVKIH